MCVYTLLHAPIYVLSLLSVIAGYNICDYGFDTTDVYNHTMIVFVIPSIMWKGI